MAPQTQFLVAVAAAKQRWVATGQEPHLTALAAPVVLAVYSLMLRTLAVAAVSVKSVQPLAVLALVALVETARLLAQTALQTAVVAVAAAPTVAAVRVLGVKA